RRGHARGRRKHVGLLGRLRFRLRRAERHPRPRIAGVGVGPDAGLGVPNVTAPVIPSEARDDRVVQTTALTIERRLGGGRSSFRAVKYRLAASAGSSISTSENPSARTLAISSSGSKYVIQGSPDAAAISAKRAVTASAIPSPV